MTAPNTNSPRRVVLRSHDWVCARAEAMLSANPGKPAGYDRSLRLPADCLKVRELCGSDGDWHQEGNELHTDMTGPWLIRYTADTEILPSWLLDVVDARARYDASETPDDADLNRMLYSRALKAAKEIDGQLVEVAA